MTNVSNMTEQQMEAKREELLKMGVDMSKSPRERADALYERHRCRSTEKIISDISYMLTECDVSPFDLIGPDAEDVREKLSKAGATEFELDTLTTHCLAHRMVSQDQIADSIARIKGEPLPQRNNWDDIKIIGVNCEEF